MNTETVKTTLIFFLTTAVVALVTWVFTMTAEFARISDNVKDLEHQVSKQWERGGDRFTGTQARQTVREIWNAIDEIKIARAYERGKSEAVE